MMTLAGFLVGCNPEGTCLSESHDATNKDSDVSMCDAKSSKRACEDTSSHTGFYPEDEAAGLARCKSLGFPVKDAKPNGQLQHFEKPVVK
jgi:hypothetical protein